MAVERPDLFRGLILLEGYNGQGVIPTPENWFDYCPLDPPDAIVDTVVTNQLPFLNVNALGHPINTGLSRGVCQTLVDRVNANGGNTTNQYLPDLEITGNSHMMFWERNSDEIAEVVLDWIDQNVDKHNDKGHGKGHGKHHGKHHGKNLGQFLKDYLGFLKSKLYR